MDIYQLMKNYNKPWTCREIAAVSVVLLAVAFILLSLYKKQRINKMQAISIFLNLCFLIVVYGSTVFSRQPGERMWNLQLFWSWRAAYEGDRSILYESLLNMILLFPAGILLPLSVGKRLKWYWGFLFGIAVSSVIEVSQLVFARGLFEFDDMLHNALGCAAGCAFCGWLQKIIQTRR